MSELRARVIADQLRDDRIDGPAEAYWRTGSIMELSARLDQRLAELSGWWREQDERDALRVVEGPFVDEPGAAVAVTVDSLAVARAACAELHAALERAQMATVDIAPVRRPRRFSLWRR